MQPISFLRRVLPGLAGAGVRTQAALAAFSPGNRGPRPAPSPDAVRASSGAGLSPASPNAAVLGAGVTCGPHATAAGFPRRPWVPHSPLRCGPAPAPAGTFQKERPPRRREGPSPRPAGTLSLCRRPQRCRTGAAETGPPSLRGPAVHAPRSGFQRPPCAQPP